MNVASLELCKELYELSGWEPKEYTDGGGENDEYVHYGSFGTVPAYDLGYLVQMLPAFSLSKFGNGDYYALWGTQEKGFNGASRSNPANAVCRLAIWLFQQGILTKTDAA